MPHKQPYLRNALRAFETPNACRLAAILKELADENRGASRDDIVARWAQLYPRHTMHTGRRSIRNRIGKILHLLRTAKIARADGDRIVVIDPAMLEIAVANLAIVVDEDGVAIPRHHLQKRPNVPAYLQALQQRVAELKLQD